MIKFVGVKDAGILEKERLVFRVLEDGDIGEFLVLSTKTYVNDDAKARRALAYINDAFWFPDTSASIGDVVVVYTKMGFSSKKENASGTRSHFFYWKRDSTVWDKAEIACVTGRFTGRNTHFLNSPEEDDQEP